MSKWGNCEITMVNTCQLQWTCLKQRIVQCFYSVFLWCDVPISRNILYLSILIMC